MLRHLIIKWTPVVLLAALAACGGGSSDSGPQTPAPPPPPPPPTPTVTLAVAPASGTVVAGNSVTATVTITRGGGFTGDVVIAAAGAPAGVTVTGGTVASAASTQVLTIAAEASAAAATASLSISGTAAGVTIAPVNYALTVQAAPPPPSETVASVTVAMPPGLLLMEDGSAALTATARNADGEAMPEVDVVWTSSNEAVATVNDQGQVTAVAAGGPVTITATAEGVSGTATLTVTKNFAALVEEVRLARGLPALGGAVITRDGIKGLGVAGTRRAAGGAAVTLDDQWHIGSNLKAVTAMLAAVAVQQGAITWDTTVSSAFPELAGRIRAEYQSVTLRELLSMQAGLPGNPPNNNYNAGGSTAKGQREWAVGWALSQAPVAAKGSYFYSNLSTVTAGAMVERALEGTYEDLIASRVGTPLGAANIGWGPQTAPGATNNPVPHTWNNNAWVPCEGCDNPPGLSAAGRSHMPLASWGRIIAELMRADAGLSDFLNATDARTLFTGVTPMPNAATDRYGLGWIMTNRAWGGRTATHSGSNVSNHSVAWLGLDTGVAFIAVTNASSTTTGAALDALVGRMMSWHQTGQ